ncbi:MAG: sulfotransferase, partial [Proteobacteria bacterium]|nr:sulfotransferase [Pseudomonadota bacterium]
LGTALRQSGDLEAAEENCRQAIGLNPQYAEAHNSLGNVFKAKEDWEAAKGAFRGALRCRRGYLDAHLNLAGVMFKAGDVEGGEAEYRKILDANDGLPEARAGLGVLLLAAGRLEEAVENFKQAVEAKPGLGIAQYNLATAAGADISEADAADLREVLDDKRILESDRTLIHFALGEIGDQKGDYETAFADFEAGNRLRKDQLARGGRTFDADEFDQRVDGIISAFCAETFDQGRGGGNATEQPVFIVGMPRSGTTLVEQIAASHPEVIGKGEIDLIRVLCGDDGDGDSDSDNAGAGAGEKGLAGQASEYLARLRDQAEDAARIIDKTPFNFLFLGRIQLMFPGARVVHCRRDALDTGLSCFRQYFTAAHEWACDLADIGRYHRAHERLMDHWQGVLSLPILSVDYEDLIGDQEKASRRLIEFLGLEWDPVCLDFHQSKRMVFTASNWQVRKPIYKSAIGRAKAYDKFLGPLKEGLKGQSPNGA